MEGALVIYNWAVAAPESSVIFDLHKKDKTAKWERGKMRNKDSNSFNMYSGRLFTLAICTKISAPGHFSCIQQLSNVIVFLM